MYADVRGQTAWFVIEVRRYTGLRRWRAHRSYPVPRTGLCARLVCPQRLRALNLAGLSNGTGGSGRGMTTPVEWAAGAMRGLSAGG